MTVEHAGALAGFISREEINALATLRQSFGVDVTRTYQFWESAVARILDGQLTDQGCPWDVEVTKPDGGVVRVEVKYSQQFDGVWAGGTRPVFRWVDNGGLGAGGAAVIVFIGLTADDQVFAWVAPASELGPTPSVTVVVPSGRITSAGGRRSRLGPWTCPVDQLLPEVLRAARLAAVSLDAPLF